VSFVGSEGFKSSIDSDLSITIGGLGGFDSAKPVGEANSLAELLLGNVGRTMGRGVCLVGEEGFWFIGPTITLGGGILGAGTGM
jgi:hypothetical protein